MNTNGNSSGRFLTHIILVLLATLWLAVVAVSWADEADAAERESGEYNFNWLDPDKKIYVLQNRRYLKAGKILVSADLGVGISNPYRQSFVIDPRITYYFSESLGIELFYTTFTNSANSTIDAISAATPGLVPVIREIKSQYGGMIQWVPWYAKINVFNQILYFDWYFSGGLGQLTTNLIDPAKGNSTENLFAGFLGTGHQYHVTESFVVRLDFTGAFYNAPIGGSSGGKTWFSNYTFGIGAGFRL